MSNSGVLPPWLVLDPLLHGWLIEDIGRGDRTTNSLLVQNLNLGSAKWLAKPGFLTNNKKSIYMT